MTLSDADIECIIRLDDARRAAKRLHWRCSTCHEELFTGRNRRRCCTYAELAHRNAQVRDMESAAA